MKHILPTILSGVIILALIFLYGWWLAQSEEFVLTKIQAPIGEDKGISVYAQFVVTQRLLIDEAADVTRITLPIYLSEPWPDFSVSFKQMDKEIKAWRLGELEQELEIGVNHLALKLDQPRLMEGKVEVVIDGSSIGHTDRELAPRVFVEAEDSYYPDGNYRIADNDKAGDVAMEIRAERSRWQSVRQRYEDNKLSLVSWIAARLVVVLVVSSLPVVILGGRFKLG